DVVGDIEIFGEIAPGSATEPGVFMESVHFLKKTVAGAPLQRPAWFFDIHQQGEALSDVGTHLVDLVMWALFPGKPIDAAKDIKLQAAERWPTAITLADFQQVTGESDFPDFVRGHIKGNALDYFCNTRVRYDLRGIAVQLEVAWSWEAAPGAGDTHLAVFRGSRA